MDDDKRKALNDPNNFPDDIAKAWRNETVAKLASMEFNDNDIIMNLGNEGNKSICKLISKKNGTITYSAIPVEKGGYYIEILSGDSGFVFGELPPSPASREELEAFAQESVDSLNNWVHSDTILPEARIPKNPTGTIGVVIEIEAHDFRFPVVKSVVIDKSSGNTSLDYFVTKMIERSENWLPVILPGGRPIQIHSSFEFPGANTPNLGDPHDDPVYKAQHGLFGKPVGGQGNLSPVPGKLY